MFINNVIYLKKKLLELLNMKSENFLYILGVQKSSELFFVKFNLYSYVIVRKWLAA